MSFDDYEEARLTRLNRAEEMARAFHESHERLTGKYRDIEDRRTVTWDDLPDNIQELRIAVALDLMDRRKVAPWSMVQRLENELQGIKNVWKDLNKLMD